MTECVTQKEAIVASQYSVISKNRRLSVNLNSGRSVRIPPRGETPLALNPGEETSAELKNMLAGGLIAIIPPADAPAEKAARAAKKES